MRVTDICLFNDAGKLKKEDLLQCLLDLGPLEIKVYKKISAKEGTTIKQLCKETGKNRTTVQKSITKLLEIGLLYRRKSPAKRGYYYKYWALPKKKLKQMLRNNTWTWYINVNRLIDNL